jgi:hypothetical protein
VIFLAAFFDPFGGQMGRPCPDMPLIGPGYCHFPKRPDDHEGYRYDKTHFDGLTAEKVVTGSMLMPSDSRAARA